MLTSQVPTNELITMEEADKRFPTECFNASVLMPYEDLMISVPKEYERNFKHGVWRIYGVSARG